MKARRNPYRVTAAWLVAAALILMGVVAAVFYYEQSIHQASVSDDSAQIGPSVGSDTPSEPGGEGDGPAPALEMEGVEVVSRSRGETEWRLQGARISQTQVEGGLVKFDDVQRATLYQDDGSTFRLSAEAGAWDTSQNDLELWGDVELAWQAAEDPVEAGGDGRASAGTAAETGQLRMWTQDLQRLRLRTDEGRLQFIGPFQLVWKVGDGA